MDIERKKMSSGLTNRLSGWRLRGVRGVQMAKTAQFVATFNRLSGAQRQ